MIRLAIATITITIAMGITIAMMDVAMVIVMRTATIMTIEATGAEPAVVSGDDCDARALFRLMTWLSPSYPVGAFAYSSGIEWAVEAGDIHDAQSLRDWLIFTLENGAGRNDAIIMAETYRAMRARDANLMSQAMEMALAFLSSRERHLETCAQGRAFHDITCAAWPYEGVELVESQRQRDIAYPVAVGAACAGHGIALLPSLHAFVHALCANWISAGVRLIPLGQAQSQHVLVSMEDRIARIAVDTSRASLDDLQGAAFRADLASMKHETQYTRLFRS